MLRSRLRAGLLAVLPAALMVADPACAATPAGDAATAPRAASGERSRGRHGADPKGEAIELPGVVVVTHSAYWLELVGFGSDGLGSAVPPPPLLVIRGEMRNASAGPLHHVKLTFELLDGDGRVVVHEEGYNRNAEALKPLDARGRAFVGDEAGARPVATRGSDTFRMLFFAAELPPFTTYRVRVVEAAPEP